MIYSAYMFLKYLPRIYDFYSQVLIMHTNDNSIEFLMVLLRVFVCFSLWSMKHYKSNQCIVLSQAKILSSKTLLVTFCVLMLWCCGSQIQSVPSVLGDAWSYCKFIYYLLGDLLQIQEDIKLKWASMHPFCLICFAYRLELQKSCRDEPKQS